MILVCEAANSDFITKNSVLMTKNGDKIKEFDAFTTVVEVRSIKVYRF